MSFESKKHRFNLTLQPPSADTQLPETGAGLLTDTSTGRSISGTITSPFPKAELPDGQLKKIAPFFKKQLKAVLLPLSGKHNRYKFFSIAAIYAAMSAGIVIGTFFVRGWRLGVIYNIARRMPVMAPSVNKLTEAGKFMSDGIVLIFFKFLYDVPKILLFVIFGFEFIELILNFFYWIADYGLGDEKRFYFQYLREEDLPDLGIALLWQLILFIIYSFIVTPTYKIMSMKYAFSRDQSIFFNWQEFKDSFRIYRSRPRATVAAYLWDLMVTGIGNLIALFLFFIPVLGFFAAAFSRFMLTHWPKSYGYGILARHLIETGVFDPAKYATWNKTLNRNEQK